MKIYNKEVKVLTADRKINQTIASLRGAKADMEAFSMETDNQNIQQMYSDCARQLESVVNNLKQQSNQRGSNQRGSNQMGQMGYGANNLRREDEQ